MPVTSVKVVLPRPVDEQCPTKRSTVQDWNTAISSSKRCDDTLIHSLHVA